VELLRGTSDVLPMKLTVNRQDTFVARRCEPFANLVGEGTLREPESHLVRQVFRWRLGIDKVRITEPAVH